MINRRLTTTLIAAALASAVLLLSPAGARAHCDGLDGPVVIAARKALESGNLNLVLPWVRKTDEPEIRAAFQKTLAVRKLSPEARDLADMYFFETVVRVHRTGEGAPYTGLKPAGRDLGPAIPAGDKAIETRSADDLLKLLTGAVREGLHARFHQAIEKSGYSRGDVDAGRKYVKAYVEYIHYVEGLYEAAKGPAEGHAHQAGEAAGHGDQRR